MDDDDMILLWEDLALPDWLTSGKDKWVVFSYSAGSATKVQ